MVLLSSWQILGYLMQSWQLPYGSHMSTEEFICDQPPFRKFSAVYLRVKKDTTEMCITEQSLCSYCTSAASSTGKKKSSVSLVCGASIPHFASDMA